MALLGRIVRLRALGAASIDRFPKWKGLVHGRLRLVLECCAPDADKMAGVG